MVSLSSNRTLEKQLEILATRLQSCESENVLLKSENISLIEQVKNLNTVKSRLEKELSRYQDSGINVD